MLTGGIDSEDDMDSEVQASNASNNSTHLKITQTEMDYLREAKRQSLNIVTVEKYFSNKQLIFNFGLATTLKCRIGFDEQSGVKYFVLFNFNTIEMILNAL